MTYHLKPISRGIYGEISKIVEEVEELVDSNEQGAKIMILNELADIIGAIGGYLENYYPDICVNDLVLMADITSRAFESGSRKPKDFVEVIPPPCDAR